MRYLRTVVLAAAAMLGACGGDSNDPVGPGADPDPTPSPGPGPGSVLQGRAIFGLTCANRLVLFGSGNPGTLVRDVPITGISAGSVMLGIDFSPAGAALYGIVSDSRVYTIDTLSGAATWHGRGDAVGRYRGRAGAFDRAEAVRGRYVATAQRRSDVYSISRSNAGTPRIFA